MPRDLNIPEDDLLDLPDEDDEEDDEEEALGDCDGINCLGEATTTVAVSVNKAHDETRNYCESCLDIYYVGVQHGRWHEATKLGKAPGRDSSQDKPVRECKKRSRKTS